MSEEIPCLSRSDPHGRVPNQTGRMAAVCGDTSSEYDRPMDLRLTPRQRAALKARAHALEPVVHVGQAGASDAVLAEVDRALTAHGLIKVKLAGAERDARTELTDVLCNRTGSVAVQQVGKIVTLWRPRPDDEPLKP